MRDEEKTKRGPKPGFWIRYTIIECVLCGRTEEYRQFIRNEPKPDDPAKRYDYSQTACQSHF